MHIGEYIESCYLLWKLEQHRLTPKYENFHPFVPLVKQHHVTYAEDNKPLKITCQKCNGFLRCSGSSGEILYITFLVCLLLEYTLKSLFHKLSTFGGLPDLKYNADIRRFLRSDLPYLKIF